MDHDERYSLVIFALIVLVSVGAVAFLFANAKSSQPKQLLNPYFLTGGAIKHFCQDEDGGIMPYDRGIAYTERNKVIDRCTADGVLEYSCTPVGTLQADHIYCPIGCEQGACAKHNLAALTS